LLARFANSTEATDKFCRTAEVSATRPRHRRAGYFVAGPLFDALDDFADLEARIGALPRQQDRGDAFEVFAEAYLATQKLVGAAEVWPADQVPVAVLQACSLPVQDLGADGVYKTWAGQYNAYQSKFRTGRPALTWQELSTFMGLTDQVGERVLFTNCDDLPAVMDARSGFYCIRGTDLERLTKDDLEAIAEWLRGAAFTRKRKEARPHQSEALEAILAGLEEHDRITAVMACAYQSAQVVGEACRGMNAFDLGIFDEAHKTAGREGAKFGFALDDRHVQIAKRAFLTATPRHYDVRKKDKEGDKALVYSMDVPAIYGPVVHTLSFAEAATAGRSRSEQARRPLMSGGRGR
jgi:predicted helicase